MAKRKIIRDEQQRRRRSERRTARKQKAYAAASAAGRRTVMRIPDVEATTGKGRTAIMEAVNAGTFPKPIPLGGRSVGWLEDEIEAWIAARIAERDQAAV